MNIHRSRSSIITFWVPFWKNLQKRRRDEKGIELEEGKGIIEHEWAPLYYYSSKPKRPSSPYAE